jgi:hypothetical protein
VHVYVHNFSCKILVNCSVVLKAVTTVMSLFPAMCPPLNLTAHLSASSAVTTVDTDVLFHCDEGWYVSGVAMVTCQLNGTWSAPQPTCELRGVYYGVM